MNYSRTIKIILGFIGILILGYNFFVADQLKYEADGDAADFIRLGVSLATFQKYGQVKIIEGGDLIKGFKHQQVKKENLEFTGHSTWRPPVWPFLIAGIFSIFGFSLTYLLVFKFVLHVGGTYLFYKTLNFLIQQPLLIIFGTFLYAVSPAWQLYSRVFLSEPVTFFFITLWAYLLINYLKKSTGFIPQAIVAGILILAHPYYLFLPFSVWFVLLIRRSIKLRSFIFSTIIVILLFSGWLIRNVIVLDTSEIILTTSSGAVMAKGWNKDVVKKHTNTQGDLAEEQLVLLDFKPEKKYQNNEVGQMLKYKDATLHFIKTNPELIFPIIVTKLKSAFNPFPETPRPGILENLRWVFHLLSLTALIFVIILSKNRIVQSLAIGLVISTIAITILTYSGFRFRMPQVAIELILVAHVLDIIWKDRSRNIKEPN